MFIEIYGSLVEVESMESEITFYTPQPTYPTRDEEFLITHGALVSWGFSGTVYEAMERYPEIVKFPDKDDDILINDIIWEQ